MAGPWEQYQQASPAAEGPWTKYSKSSEEPISSEIPAARVPASNNPLVQFGRSAASLADVALGAVPGIVQQVAYPTVRVFTSPQRAQELSQTVASPFEKPVGKLFGVTETPEYQMELSRQLMDFVGENINKGTKWLAEQTGIPEQDMSSIVGSLTMAGPKNILAGVKETRNALIGPVKAGERATTAAAGISGGFTGKAPEAFSEAFRAGRANETSFLDNLRGKTKPDELLTTLKQGLEKIQQDATQAYSNAKTGWSANPQPLDFAPIDSAYANLKSSLEQRGHLKIGSSEQNILNEIGAVLDEWRSDPAARTALDFDALKQRIDAIYPESPKHTNAQRAVTSIRNAVKDEITKNVPEYAEAMKSYEIQKDLLRDIAKGLSTGDKVAKETTMNKIMNALKSTPSAEMRRELINAIEQQGGVSVMPALAGQELGQWFPSSGFGKAALGGGLTSAAVLHNPAMLGVLPFTSPRLMGEAYYGAGRAAGLGRQAVNALSKLSPAEQAYANALLVQAQQQDQNALAR